MCVTWLWPFNNLVQIDDENKSMVKRTIIAMTACGRAGEVRAMLMSRLLTVKVIFCVKRAQIQKSPGGNLEWNCQPHLTLMSSVFDTGLEASTKLLCVNGSLRSYKSVYAKLQLAGHRRAIPWPMEVWL